MSAAEETSGFAQVSGFRLHYSVSVVGKAASWIVFSNSLMTDLSIWDDQVDSLRKHYNILRYDQPGHGRSSLPTEFLDFDILGSCVLGLLDWLGIRQCSAVGLSMGVPTLLAAYGAQPERFCRLVVVDGQSRTAGGGKQNWEERIAFVQQHGMAAMADATVERWLQPPARTDQRGARLRALIASTPREGFIGCARALQDYNFTRVLDRIEVPLMALAGANDGAMPATMKSTFGALPGACFEQIDNAGHLPNFEQPRLFNERLQDFLAGKLV